MKISAAKSNATGRIKIEIWATEEEALALFPSGYQKLAAHMEICVKEHMLTGHRSTRQIPETDKP